MRPQQPVDARGDPVRRDDAQGGRRHRGRGRGRAGRRRAAGARSGGAADPAGAARGAPRRRRAGRGVRRPLPRRVARRVARRHDARLLVVPRAGPRHRTVLHIRQPDRWSGRSPRSTSSTHRVRHGDLRAWQAELDAMRHDATAKVLVPTAFSPLGDLDLSGVPAAADRSAARAPAVHGGHGVAAPGSARRLPRARRIALRADPRTSRGARVDVLELVPPSPRCSGPARSGRSCSGSASPGPSCSLPLLSREVPAEHRAPGTWMHDALEVRDRWESRLLRVAPGRRSADPTGWSRWTPSPSTPAPTRTSPPSSTAAGDDLRRAQHAREPARRSGCSPSACAGRAGGLVRPQQHAGPRVHPRRPQGRASSPCRRPTASTPTSCSTSPTTATPSLVVVDAEHADEGRGRPRPAAEGARGRRVRRCAVRGRPRLGRRRRAPGPTTSPRRLAGRAGATMIYTSGTTGKPKGALRTSTDPVLVATLLQVLRLEPGDEVHITTGPLYHSGPLAWASLSPHPRRHDHPHAPLRRRAVGRPRARAPRHEHVHRAHAAEADRGPARRGAGPCRPVVDALARGQRRACPVHVEAGADRQARRRLPLRGVRLDRARRRRRAPARGPAAQARARAASRTARSSSRSSTTTATSSRSASRASCSSARPPPSTATTPPRSGSPTSTGGSPSATSPTSTTRATSTSATARRT